MKHGMFIKSTLTNAILCSAIALPIAHATAVIDSSYGTAGAVTTSFFKQN